MEYNKATDKLLDRIATALENQNEILAGRPNLSPVIEKMIPAAEKFIDYLECEYGGDQKPDPDLYMRTWVHCNKCDRDTTGAIDNKIAVCADCGSDDIRTLPYKDNQGAGGEEKKE